MSDHTESTGTAGAGTAWSHPLPETAPDGSRIVYVAVPNEDQMQMTQEHFALKIEREPRINALTTILGLRQFSAGVKIEDVLKDARKVERYIRTGKVGKASKSETEGDA